MHLTRAAALITALVLAASPAYAGEKGKHARSHEGRRLSWQEVLFAGLDLAREPQQEEAAPQEPADLTAYEGLGSWIDIFNVRPWENPKGAVRTLAKRGAKTIFLQTSTYGQSGGIFDEQAVNDFLHEAHRRGMKVVAWYVPSFAQQKIDLRRALRAIEYRSPSGERFDSFGLDIEATHVRDISVRNARLLALSRRIRKAAGPSYPLSAITPDPVTSSYWPGFPWKAAADIYDVIVPMGYFTFRAHGFEEVREYTEDGIETIRDETGDEDVPIHFIGGIADEAGPVDLKGFVKASREHEVMGASLYDYPITSRRSWYELRALDATVAQRRREEAREQRAAAALRARRARAAALERRIEGRRLKRSEDVERRRGKNADPPRQAKGSGARDPGDRNGVDRKGPARSSRRAGASRDEAAAPGRRSPRPTHGHRDHTHRRR